MIGSDPSGLAIGDGPVGIGDLAVASALRLGRWASMNRSR